MDWFEERYEMLIITCSIAVVIRKRVYIISLKTLLMRGHWKKSCIMEFIL